MDNNCFAFSNGNCTRLDVSGCTYPKCKFYKAKTVYEKQRVKAIKRCRKLGICYGCKYVSKPCKLRSDKDSKE